MALSQYGVFVGTATDKLDSTEAKAKNPNGSPHYEILVENAGVQFRLAVNVKSDQQPSDLQFFLDDNYQHPILELISQLPRGFTRLQSKAGTAALDFVRGNLFDLSKLRIVPAVDSASHDDLNDIFDVHVEQAMNTPGSLIYAFGSHWGPEQKPDDYFGFTPGNGIHDIHMNQGNKGSHAGDNGEYQDGVLFIHHADEDRWVAMFLKFQSQVISGPVTTPAQPPATPSPTPAPPISADSVTIKIIAALVNPQGDDVTHETVYLLNTTDMSIDINNWKIVDKHELEDTVTDTVIGAGAIAQIALNGEGAQLSNDGGIITLINAEGVKIDGVSYTKQQVQRQGFVVPF